MPGARDIKAGAAYVELYAKDSGLKRGLSAARTTLKAFGAAASVVGAGVLTIAKRFAEVGSEIHDMAGRTGLGTTALQELGHAASMTGGDISDVETAVKRMQKTLGDAANGSKSANDALRRVGLTLEKLKGLRPEDQFFKIAEQLRAIENPTERAAVAMALFGKSGTKLLPMINDMEALREEAHKLGIVMSEEQVKAADELGDAIEKAEKAVGGLATQLGAALAPSIIAGAEKLAEIFGNMATNSGKISTITQALIEASARGGIGGKLASGLIGTDIGAEITRKGQLIERQLFLLDRIEKFDAQKGQSAEASSILAREIAALERDLANVTAELNRIGSPTGQMFDNARPSLATPPATPASVPDLTRREDNPKLKLGLRKFQFDTGIEADDTERDPVGDLIDRIKEKGRKLLKRDIGGEVAGSFSAAALRGAAGSPIDKLLDEQKEHKRELIRIRRALEKGGLFI